MPLLENIIFQSRFMDNFKRISGRKRRMVKKKVIMCWEEVPVNVSSSNEKERSQKKKLEENRVPNVKRMEKKTSGVTSLFRILPAWMVGEKKPPYYRKGSGLATEIKTYDQSGKSVRNGARKNTFVSDRRRINCCGADKKSVKVKNSFCVGCGKGWAKGWMIV
ncbi:hypothetical protein CDAR_54971 [Caerostris darwini]|uniref:Uncharacterized protein n=1 Tax=Caerostris darwini TaxID=1538125 RepID=A0AAV4PBD0_9ARAC|nr:hypothetical protein CDAR_54971 [Caerostris darwini]